MEKKNQDNTWVGWCISVYVGAILIILLLMCAMSCSPKIVYKTETKIEYRDRVVHDTTTVEIPKEIEKIVTKDTVSHLENRYAKSDALVSEGMLYHSLESIPQVIKVPVEVHVTDTLYKEAQIIEKEVKVEKPLSGCQKVKIGAFWWLLGGLVLSLVWIFRKQIVKLIKLVIC